jgi:hypothetical protein
VKQFVRPSGQIGQLREVARALAAGPTAEPASIGTALHDLAGRLGRRGVVFVFSDLLDDVPEFLGGLQHLRFQKPELDFPFRHPTLFRGLEQLPEVFTDPVAIRDGYLTELNKHLDAIEAGCRGQETDLVRLRTDADLGHELATYLQKRTGR